MTEGTTLRQLVRGHRPRITNGDIAQAIADEFGKPISDQSVSNYLAGFRPWPAKFMRVLHAVLTESGLELSRPELFSLAAMTKDEIERIEGGTE
jgi:hypothetical protein